MTPAGNIYKTKLYTDRLVLRFPKNRDAADLFEFCRDPSSSLFAPWSPHKNIQASKSYIKFVRKNRRNNSEINFFIELKDSGKVVGTCAFVRVDSEQKCAEIGYCLSAAYRRRGIGAEAVRRMVVFGFESLGFNRIEARVVTENAASLRLLEHVGFTNEGRLRDAATLKGKVYDLYIFGITRKDYFRLKG